MAYDSGALIAGTVVLEVVAIVFLALRFAIRRHRKTSLGADDWTATASLVIITATSVLQIWACARRLLYTPPVWPLRTEEQRKAAIAQLTLANETILAYTLLALITPALGLARLSITCLYKRVFVTKMQQRVIWIWIGFNVLWMVAFEFATIFVCGTDFATLTDADSTKNQLDRRRCNNNSAYITYTALSTSLFADIVTLVLPLPMVWRLQMPNSRKMTLSATLVINLLSLCASVLKTVSWIEVITPNSNGNARDQLHDPFLKYRKWVFWSTAEVHLFIIMACAVIVAPSLGDLLPKRGFRTGLQTLRSHISLRSRGSEKTAASGASPVLNRADKHSSPSSPTELMSKAPLGDLEVDVERLVGARSGEGLLYGKQGSGGDDRFVRQPE